MTDNDINEKLTMLLMPWSSFNIQFVENPICKLQLVQIMWERGFCCQIKFEDGYYIAGFSKGGIKVIPDNIQKDTSRERAIALSALITLNSLGKKCLY